MFVVGPLAVLLTTLSITFCNIQIFRAVVTKQTTTFTFTFGTAFSITPSYTYYIEAATLYGNGFQITHHNQQTSITNTKLTIAFQLVKNNIINNQTIRMLVIVTQTNTQLFSVGIFTIDATLNTTTALPYAYDIQNTFYEAYSLTYPISWTKTMAAMSCFINLTTTPIWNRNITFSYIYVDKTFLSKNIFSTFYEQINQKIHNYQAYYSLFAFTPEQQNKNMFYAMKRYDSSSIPFIDLDSYIQIQTTTSTTTGSLKLGYFVNTVNPTVFQFDVILFNTNFDSCATNQYLQYATYFFALPKACKACHSTCHTCTSSSHNSMATDNNSCTTCSYLRYLNLTESTLYGACLCFPGLLEYNLTCLECEENCLSFSVLYMQTTNQSQFMLTFTSKHIQEVIPINLVLIVKVQNVSVQYNIHSNNPGIYLVDIALSDISICQGIICNIYFQFQSPQNIVNLDTNKGLSMNNLTVLLQKYVISTTLLPTELSTAFLVINMMIGVSISGGLSSMMKLIFELEQTIDYHKYINLTMPVVFNQFILSLNSFKFLDLTALFPNDIVNQIQGIAPDNLDAVGPPFALYFHGTVNFYSNIVMALISFIIIITINFLLSYMFQLIPFSIFQKLSAKIKVRRLITIHDGFESMILPIIVAAQFQLFYVIPMYKLYWVYWLTYMTVIFTLILPWMVALYVYYNKQDKEKTEIFEDLLQDSSLEFNSTYIFYVFNFYRKVVFGMLITFGIPGILQICLIILLNMLYFSFQLYILCIKAYLSKIKMFIRLLNSISLIAIETLIIVYNVNEFEVNIMISIGLACLYMALITTVLGILEIIIKIVDTIRQEINGEKQVEDQPIDMVQFILDDLQKPPEKQFINNMICHIGKQFTTDPQKESEAIFDKELEAINQSTFIYKNQDQNPAQQLVFIDDDWDQIFPVHSNNHLLTKYYQEEPKQTVELYQISQDLEKEIIQESMQKILPKKAGNHKEQKNNQRNLIKESRRQGNKKINTQQLIVKKVLSKYENNDEEVDSEIKEVKLKKRQ